MGNIIDKPYQINVRKYFKQIKINEKPYAKSERKTKKNFKRANKNLKRKVNRNCVDYRNPGVL